ncbi:MAG: Type II secretion system protein F [Chlamydiae bacterium]|nr:Type II secretion system protein F [Chlamydiota bacterium]
MPLYHYHALDSHSKKHKGVIEAQGEKEAKIKLRDRGLMVTQLSTKVKVSSKENLKSEALVTFTFQLSQLVNAGVPLYQSLVTIEEQNHRERYHRILLSLCDQIKGGSSLSESMKAYPDSFSKLYSSMIAAGEASGNLGLVLERLTELLSKQQKLKGEITTSMIYPGVLAIFSLLVIGLLLGFVVPSIEGIFVDRKLNNFTRFVLGMSHFFRDWWWVYIPLIFCGVGFVVWQFYTEKGREKIEKLLMRVPVVKTLIIQAALTRFSRTMATLQQGGLTIIESLRMSRAVLNNRLLEREVAEAEQKIMEGSSLSQELKQSRYIPSIVPTMLAIGEETGKSVTMLHSIADMYESSLEKTLGRLVALAQPVILIVMGGIIGLVMLAILLPLSDIASFTGSP